MATAYGDPADRDAPARYTHGAIAFHWVVGALVLVNLAIGLLHDAIPFPVIPLHKSIGLTVLGLSAGRLLWRLTHPAPRLPDHVPGWQRGLAHLTHWAFYGLMFAMPLSGWIMVSGEEKRYPLSWFGLFKVPYIVPQASPAGATADQAHLVLGWLWVALLVLHVAGALKHHLVDRDSVLVRMAPWLRTPIGK